LGEDFQGIASV